MERTGTKWSLLVVLVLCLSLVPGLAFAHPGLHAAGMADFAAQASGKSAHVNRVGGTSDYSTMMEICEEGFAKDSCKAVVLVGKDATSDAVSAAGLAGVLDCPVLLADKYDVPVQTLFEIARVGAKKAYIVGGRSSVSNAVVEKLRLFGLKAKRVGSGDAAATANKVYAQGKKVGGWSKTAIVIGGASKDDAIAASAYSFAQKAPLFIASKKTKSGYVIPKATLKLLKSGKFERVLCLGGTSAVSKKALSQVKRALPKASIARVAGKNAVGISQRMANKSVRDGASTSKVGFASRTNVRIGLMGGVLCGKLNAPCIVVAPSKTSSATKGYVTNHKRDIKTCLLFGSTKVISNDFRIALKKVL